MKTKKPHEGTQGIGQGPVKHIQRWNKCFTKWVNSQAELLIMAGFIVDDKVLL